MKRAQNEMIGIIIIVFIILIVGTIAVRNILMPKESRLKKYLEPDLPTRILQTLMNTDTATGPVYALITACYNTPGNCQPEDCCTLSFIIIKNALDATLGSKSYLFSVSKGNTEPKILGTGCTGDRVTGFYYISDYPNDIIEARLDVCT